ncbi:T9SS type A sorting domain-containing protein [Hymenobacter elongatus]|uniref:T9SS type A sorting domain-containing protein n=1 Tax=Hymenobacter elongatus TaxID=877208 RepID=A0A4Z0PGP5_9BACT|nr:T9SS type A sorting domain-containing protein [Hymenobacter elongatus]TGE14344.1 T9SS type A sorting domain-containing protein [Hymenobacter elongatus]
MRNCYSILSTLLLLLATLRAAGQGTPGLSVSSAPPLPFATVLSTPSNAGNLVVSGFNLTDNITVSAPSGFEVALAATATYAASQTLARQSNGLVNNAPVLIRLTGAAVGTFSGNVSISSPNAATLSVAVTGLVAAAANPAATLTGISPSTGMPGTMLVNFYGRNFVPGATASIYNGPFVVGPTTFVSSGHLTAMVTIFGVPSPVTGYGSVGNPPPGGGGTTPPGTVLFTAVPGPPTITSFSPALGLPGTLVTINGIGFLQYYNNTVLFNGVLAPLYGTPSSGQLTVRVPAGATTGPITVTTVGGTATSATSFVVPPVFFEDFEAGAKNSYTPASVQLFTTGWTFAEALIGTTANADKFNGTKSARLRGGGFLEMDTDKPNGAGVVTVSAAMYGTETGVSFRPEISTDGGITYTSLLGPAAAPVLTGTLTQYSFTANRSGTVRLRFSSTNVNAATNPRISLDDIGITDFGTPTAAAPGRALPALQAYPNPAHDYVLVETGTREPVTVALFDRLGREVLPTHFLPATQRVSLPATLPAGLYLLQVRSRSGQRTVRLVKE